MTTLFSLPAWPRAPCQLHGLGGRISKDHVGLITSGLYTHSDTVAHLLHFYYLLQARGQW